MGKFLLEAQIKRALNIWKKNRKSLSLELSKDYKNYLYFSPVFSCWWQSHLLFCHEVHTRSKVQCKGKACSKILAMIWFCVVFWRLEIGILVFYFVINLFIVCCVLWPAVGCCAHPKVGQNTFLTVFRCFSTFCIVFLLFRPNFGESGSLLEVCHGGNFQTSGT